MRLKTVLYKILLNLLVFALKSCILITLLIFLGLFGYSQFTKSIDNIGVGIYYTANDEALYEYYRAIDDAKYDCHYHPLHNTYTSICVAKKLMQIDKIDSDTNVGGNLSVY